MTERGRRTKKLKNREIFLDFLHGSHYNGNESFVIKGRIASMGRTDVRGNVKVVSYLVWLTQLGLSVAVPLAGFVLLGVWLHNSRGWGGWTVAAGILLGIFGAVGGLYSCFKTLNQMLRQDDPAPTQGYNKHE